MLSVRAAAARGHRCGLLESDPWISGGEAARRCPECGLWRSNLRPEIGTGSSELDEARRQSGLLEVRSANDARVLSALGRWVDPGSRLLDVGCGYGWFISLAEQAGYLAEGIEPDPEVAKAAIAEGRTVRQGFFPEALSEGERFSAITFNDVLEHVPNPIEALRAAGATLAPRGIVSVNLPVSSGPIFRAAHVAARLGWSGPFRRLWQEGFPSPHLWYFNYESLVLAASRAGLVPVGGGWLDAVTASGAASRANYGSSGVTAWIGAGVSLLAPVVNRIRPGDILFVLFRRSVEPETA